MTDVLGSHAILAPVVALVAWSIIMIIWMFAVRMPAMSRLDSSVTQKPGMRGSDLEGVVPDKVQWPAHNHTHLMEQPTLFYAIAITLALLGAGGGLGLLFAWGYVVFRIAHSIVQSTVNVLALRFLMYLLATACLIGLTVRAILVLVQTA